MRTIKPSTLGLGEWQARQPRTHASAAHWSTTHAFAAHASATIKFKSANYCPAAASPFCKDLVNHGGEQLRRCCIPNNLAVPVRAVWVCLDDKGWKDNLEGRQPQW